MESVIVTENVINNPVALFKSRFGLPSNYELPLGTIKALQGLPTSKELDDIAIRSIVDTSPSVDAIASWKTQFVQLFGDEARASQLSEKLLGGLEKIEQDQFEQNLGLVFSEALNGELSSFDLDRTRFVYYSGGKQRSAEWVKKVCLEHFPQSPLLKIPSLDYYDKQLSGNYEFGVILDDASYSGTQLSDHLKYGHERFGMKQFVVIAPYMTDHALSQIKSKADECKVDSLILRIQKIKTMKEVIGNDDYEWLKKASPTYRIEEGQTLTYFAHKVPDYRSFCPYIGNTRHVEVESFLDSLVPQKPAVYHSEYLSSIGK